MASVQEPEVQFAQRLASNEKPVRTRAIKKLRKYISVRSIKGGFTGDELLKLWKGLFYCLWMQDKPLLQEELSRQISGLIHSFQSADGQFLYVESFLQTVKREWTGIDRLRMDKFFQLVRFMFRQTFEMLQRTNWESSLVSRFLQLLTAQLLQSDSAAPSGLQFHALDVYLTELAAVGSTELVADQNLTFIAPFCKTAAKTKDRTLFKAICSSIFSTIIDQAPFAIQDLMKELKGGGASDSDSGQASEEDDEEDGKRGQRAASNAVKDKTAKRQVNGKKLNEEEEDEEEEEDDDTDDDELRHLEELDSEDLGDDGDVGPVLQFDYGALAAKLLEQASRSGTPSHNRQRLYKIIKVLRDLSEGIFPQDEYPEEVSTDEDDDMFGSRKRMKRKRKHKEEEEDKKEASMSKKTKAKKKDSAADQQENTENAVKEDEEPADPTAINDKKKKKRKKKKKKKKKGGHEAENIEMSQLEVAVASDKETEAQTQSSASRMVIKKAEGLSEVPPTSEVTAITEETSQSPDNTGNKKNKKKKKKKKGVKSEPAVAEPLLGAVVPPAGNDEAPDGKTSAQKDNLKKAEPEVKLNAAIVKENPPAAALEEPARSETPGKKKSRKKKLKAGEDGAADCGTTPVAADPSTPSLEKKKEQEDAAISPSAAAPTPLKKTKKNQKKKLSTDMETVDGTPAQDESAVTDLPSPQNQTQASSGKPAKKKKRKIPVEFEYEADELQAVASGNAEEETVAKKTKLVSGDGEPSTPGGARRSQRKSKSSSASDFITFQTDAATPTPLFCRGRGGAAGTLLSSKKVSRTPASESKKVTFGLKNNKTAEFRKTDRSLLVSPDGSSRVPFDPQQKPKFGVLKSPETPLSAKNRNTPNGGRKSSGPAPRRRPSAADFF